MHVKGCQVAAVATRSIMSVDVATTSVGPQGAAPGAVALPGCSDDLGRSAPTCAAWRATGPSSPDVGAPAVV